MQRLDLRNNLHELITGLQSQTIVDLLDSAALQGNILLKHIIDSKAAFDRASTDPEMVNVFEQFNLSEIYSTNNFTSIIAFISGKGNANTSRTQFLTDQRLTTFYSQHKTLLATFNIVENLLLKDVDFFNEERTFDIVTAQNNGNLILQIIDESNVSLSKLEDILSHLQKLIENVYLLYDKVEGENFTDTPEITLIDSGSDINFSVKLPKKAANLIAQIIEQLWDVIVNNKSFRHNQKLKDVESTITVLGKINDAKESGGISPEMAEVLKKGIFENARQVILSNTLTKQIVIETKEVSNRTILLEQTKTYKLEQGENKETEENSEQ